MFAEAQLVSLCAVRLIRWRLHEEQRGQMLDSRDSSACRSPDPRGAAPE